jgi:very-short-patch-repair endonuclease
MTPETTTRAALRAWRDGLVNLDAGNRLINFRRSETGTVEIAGPPPGVIVGALRSGGEHGFAGEGEFFRTGLDPQALGTILRRLLRKARQDFLDRGVDALYLSVGMLHWRDEEGATFASPLLLLPVELTSAGPADLPKLRGRDDDPVVNPALVLRMRLLGVDLPAVESLAELDLPEFLTRVRAATAGRDARVEETVLLSAFSFHKEAMYRDLHDNEKRILAHPVVQSLACLDGTPGFAPIPPADVDRLAPPEEVPLVLDADASQRACVAAATAGHSFVMDGPPGTGKSQTIANMIGCLLHAGKRVLFVSEKAAALEIVRNRLADVGLDDYLLELHSHKATRKEVARGLADAVDAPPASPAAGKVGAAQASREGLSAYATAMNEVREPLGSSLHDILGRCAELAGVPAAPAPAPVTLTPETLRQIRDAADQLARSWRPAALGDDFAWREVTEHDPLDGRLQRAEHALRELAGAAGRNAALAAAFGLARPSAAASLAALAEHAVTRPAGVDDAWLTLASLRPVRRAAGERGRHLAAVRQAREAVRAAAGVEWDDLPDGLTPVQRAETRPAAVDPAALSAEAAAGLARRFDDDATLLEDRMREVARITTALTLPAAATFNDVARVVAICELGGKANRPEPYWFGAGVLAKANTAVTALRRAVEALTAAEGQARRYFHESILDQPVEDLSHRLTKGHRGLFRKLFGAYRRDYEAVAAFALPTQSASDAVAHLGTAVAWRAARRDLAGLEHEHAAVLGRFWRGATTDFAALNEALQVAADLLRWTPPQAMPAVIDHVCAPSPDEGLLRAAASVSAAIARWQATLRPAPDAAARPDLAHGAVRDAIAWLRANAVPLAAAARFVGSYDEATGRTLDLAGAERLAALRQAVVDAQPTKTGIAGADTRSGADVDESAAIDWAATARQLGTGSADKPLTPAQAAALADATPAAGLAGKAAAWTGARDAVAAAFGTARRAALIESLEDYERGPALLRELREDSSGQEEWFSHAAAREVLSGFGLDDAVTFCADERVPTGQLRAVLERAVLRSWADDVLHRDKRLHPVRAEERTHLVGEFRTLDRDLIASAPARIAAVLNTARASLPAEETALLRREGRKETRHLAVRDLIGRARTAVLAMKPCFLMSPLAVSQYLPPDIDFDVVIFDEASQVTPADAINCIYRAGALVAAGDDKQLPPTSFFETTVDSEVSDFQSILELAKACGAFPSLGLGWHYRSRHESLIAFANQAFYQGRLVTFPAADSAGPDAGVHLVAADGVYRRGTTRDNPVEAAVVAERVVAALTERPDLSLGVVTFSVAQAEAIEAALEGTIAAPLLDGDRLNGFFVKSLESVQGDERDVMIFSIGYGHDEQGRISTNFGALSRPNGWRRLNVAITRARQRVEIVSSIRSRDIPPTANESVRFLAAYLDFVEQGGAFSRESLMPDEPLEASVRAAIESWGYRVRTRIGSGGYRLDIGVLHPGHDDAVYALGVECDGAMYHACATARDRDRLRSAVLEGLGWQLHRVWGTAWYRDRAEEEARLRAAVEKAVASTELPARAPLHRPGPLSAPRVLSGFTQ